MKKLLLILCIVFVSCDSCPETESVDTSCFKDASKMIKDKTTSKLNFAEIVNCFEWDRLEIHAESNHKKYKCFRFHQIDDDNGVYLGKNIQDHTDWIDGDRHWYFVHFYKDEQLVSEILAISESFASFSDLTKKGTETPSFTKENANFYFTKKIYGGVSGQTMLKQRQLIKLQ